MATKRVPALSPSTAFLHVVYEYRYFALAAGAWRRFGPSGSSQDQQAANILLPGIGVLLQDSLLAHARGLIDFYAKDRPRPTDVVLADFQLPSLPTARKKQLTRYKEPIEVHLLHITAWRDVTFRKKAAKTPEGVPRQRIDWNRKNQKIVDRLLRALETVSKPGRAPWSTPFHLLHRSALAVVANPSAPWPTELTEKADVVAYLLSLGL